MFSVLRLRSRIFQFWSHPSVYGAGFPRPIRVTAFAVYFLRLSVQTLVDGSDRVPKHGFEAMIADRLHIIPDRNLLSAFLGFEGFVLGK